MSITPTIINGYELYPAEVSYDLTWVGGPPRESLSGVVRRKRIGQGGNIVLRFESISADEYAYILVIWAQAGQGAVTIVDSAEGINDSFIITNDTLGFKRAPGTSGATALWSGTLSFKKQKAS